MGDTSFLYHYAWDSRILQAFARVLERARGKDLNVSAVKKMLYYFERGKDDNFDGTDGWGGWDLLFNFQGKAQPQYTAAAVQALDTINQMLDERINAMIFKHFRVKMPRDLEKVPELDELFYPDYGLMSNKFLVSEEPQRQQEEREKEKIPWDDIPEDLGGGNGTSWDSERLKSEIPYVHREESVAFTLQRLRAHVARVDAPRPFHNAVHSVVFHGPAGTGKTTLPESLAKTCKVPLVEVTPSDIIVTGQENVERRARAVFTALALLTRTVVIFDEFDPIVWKRDPEVDKGTHSLYVSHTRHVA